jgi:hypothetical protein
VMRLPLLADRSNAIHFRHHFKNNVPAA